MGLMSYFWVFVVILSVIIEAATMGLATIWFAFGGLAAWIVQLMNFSFVFQIFTFLIVSSVLLIFTRPFAIKHLKVGKTATNVDGLIGKTGKVVEGIDNINAKGKIKISGQIWTSRSENEEMLKVDQLVEVVRVEGVKLIVKKIKED